MTRELSPEHRDILETFYGPIWEQLDDVPALTSILLTIARKFEDLERQVDGPKVTHRKTFTRTPKTHSSNRERQVQGGAHNPPGAVDTVEKESPHFSEDLTRKRPDIEPGTS